MLKIILIISYLLDNLFDWFLVKLNDINVKKPLPDNVKDVYDEAQYYKWINYRTAIKKVDSVSSIVNALLTVIFLSFNVHSRIYYLFGMNKYVAYIFFVLIFSVAALPFSIPFEYYRNFVVEEKFGFNKTTKKTFWADQIKSFVLETVLSVILFLGIMFLFETFGNLGILFTCIAVLLFNLFVAFFSLPIMRIFNKFTPLEEGDLRNELLSLCDKYNVKVKNIYVMDASKRTTRSNAFCTGLAKKKTISLDDNLVNNFTTKQIVSVFAHEFGHAKHKHTVRSVWFAFFRIIILIAALGVILNFPVFCEAFGFKEVNYYFAFTVLTTISWPVSRVFDLISNSISRKFEYQADAFAAKEGYGDELISSLKKLSQDSLTNLNPHPFVVKMEHSHPTLSQRIDSVNKNRK